MLLYTLGKLRAYVVVAAKAAVLLRFYRARERVKYRDGKKRSAKSFMYKGGGMPKTISLSSPIFPPLNALRAVLHTHIGKNSPSKVSTHHSRSVKLFLRSRCSAPRSRNKNCTPPASGAKGINEQKSRPRDIAAALASKTTILRSQRERKALSHLRGG